MFHLNNNILYEDLLDEWFDNHSLEVAESTMRNYVFTMKNLKKVFSHRRAKSISTNELQDLLNKMYLKGMSQNTIINYSKVMSMSFKYAVKKGYLAESPYKNITIPKREKKDIEPFTIEEVKLILEVPMQDWLHDAIEIAFRTGMRKGEIFALKVEDIDFPNNFLMVKRTQSLSFGGIIVKSPKTKASKRRIDCDNRVMEILRRRSELTTSRYIFTYSDGSMQIPWNITADLKRKCISAGVKPRRFHDLRHGHATYLLINNVHPKIVQERLGHTNINMTLDTYSHLVPGMQQVAVDVLNKI